MSQQAPAPAAARRLEPSDVARAQAIVERIGTSFRSRVVGQGNLQLSLVVALMTGGHVLLESVPGLAKTTAAATLADAVQGSFTRIQCTPDLLPADIVGTQVYEPATGQFSTQLGPVHANFVLLDEINRSSAKTQSAMLEAMQERQTSIGGVIHELPKPFVVLATQNPIEQEGTYELPEAQLDRFLLKEILTYPSHAEEIEILDRIEREVFDQDLPAGSQVSLDEVRYLQGVVKGVYLDPAIKSYIVALVQATRPPSRALGERLGRYLTCGASPRASITFQQVARALAVVAGRTYVIPEDVQRLRHQVLRHRIILNFEAVSDRVTAEQVVDAVFAATPTP
ncbi:AAA family ATPase [Occultella gossypii]|uniref:MoxR family ATPase n=1 Tax=Occultella gossypii TaxID=2800820 RepID=A0ABS7SAD1_9MICO|nr:MoxR family ATPase [Occultella gossypii]MBZ2197295.1 MoxR family ATPase [Occultella gossypii]